MSREWLEKTKVDDTSRALKTISQDLVELFEDESRPNEDQLRRAVRLVARAIVAKQFEDNSVASLAEYTDAFHAYSDLGPLEERLFDIGACWGAVNAFRAVAAEEWDRADDEMRRSQLEAYRDIFLYLADHSESKHSDLASALNYKVSRFSQIMSKLSESGLVTSTKLGREKHYRLTAKSKELMANRKITAAAQWTETAENSVAIHDVRVTVGINKDYIYVAQESHDLRVDRVSEMKEKAAKEKDGRNAISGNQMAALHFDPSLPWLNKACMEW